LPPRLLSEDDDFSDSEVEIALRGGSGLQGRKKKKLPSVAETGNLSPLLAPATGAPALSLPLGFTRAPEEDSETSLPAGLQLVGRPFGDAELVRVAAAVERALWEKQREDEEEGKRSRGRGRVQRRRSGGGGLLLLGSPPPLFRECG